MRTSLSDDEIAGLLWIYQKRSVYSFKKKDPDINTIRVLVKKRLVRANVVIRHPSFVHMYVTKFHITRKGKRYAQLINKAKQLTGKIK